MPPHSLAQSLRSFLTPPQTAITQNSHTHDPSHLTGHRWSSTTWFGLRFAYGILFNEGCATRVIFDPFSVRTRSR